MNSLSCVVTAVLREQCEELRSICSRLTEQQVSQERTAQVRSRQAQQRQQQEEDLLFSELWAGDGRAKEELEGARAQSRRHRNEEQRSILCRQMEAAEQQRQRERELKEEEARLLVCSAVITVALISNHHKGETQLTNTHNHCRSF